jgi:diguanylate cyclase (GGDEF)-like protein
MTAPSRPRILIVDDQPLNRLILESIVSEHYDLTAAENGAEAIRLCLENPPDLVLLDVLMPGMGGLEVCRVLKSRPETAEIPVIFITTQSDPLEETAGLDAGAADFISKPVNASVVLARIRTHLTLKRQSDLLRSQAFTDPLTGIGNRRRLDESLDHEWRRGLRNRSSLGVLMIDIDHFKRLNDANGHAAGDETLRRVAALLSEKLNRPQDLVARYGGEEFACLLPDTPLYGAARVAVNLVESVAELRIEHPDSPTSPWVSVSIGYAATVPESGDQPETLLATADRYLYDAKMLGRNHARGAMMESARLIGHGPGGR